MSQTTISRLERGKAPHIAIDRILALQAVLGGCLPMGICPHEHPCVWQPRSEFEREMLHRPAAIRGLSFQWPHDDAGNWADEYHELPSGGSSWRQSPSEIEIAPPTGLDEEEDGAEATDLEPDDQTKLPDWMFEVVGPPRP